MFNRIKGTLGQQVTEDEIDPTMDDMYPESFDSTLAEVEPNDINNELLNSDPQGVLNDSNSSVELKKMAMQKVLDKYLKPKDEE
jgi:hypothetical protein